MESIKNHSETEQDDVDEGLESSESEESEEIEVNHMHPLQQKQPI